MDTAAMLFHRGLPPVQGDGGITLDFTQVDAVDSAAVSLMLVWLRAAQQKKIPLSFINVPENLLSLTHLYGVAESLPLQIQSEI